MPRTMSVKRRSMWSSARKLSGTITRSTDEWLMSRSCQSATFSSAASAFARTSRARPVTCSQPTGLRLCGMAELPFWLSPNGSSTSRTSVFCSARTSVANVSRLAARIASVVITSAWRSRCSTCEAIGAGCEAQPRADRLLDRPAAGARTCPPRPRACPPRSSARARDQALAVARELGVPERELQPERHGLGVHAVGAADHRRVACARSARALTASSSASTSWSGSGRTRRACSSASAVSTTSDDVSP